MICEVCGKEFPFVKRVLIEGSVMRVCNECTKFGREIDSRRPIDAGNGANVKFLMPTKKQHGVKDIYNEMGDTELVPDFGAKIRAARAKMGLKQEDLGKLINEKKSVIEQLENGRIHPGDKLVEKLEKALKIKLKEKVIEEPLSIKHGGSGLTLGDLIKTEKR